MVMIDARPDRIRRLRIPGRQADALGVRFAVERAFRGRTLRPSGVSAQAIVCVRHVRVHAGDRADTWAHNLDREMQKLAARAVRPFREPVPASADVIVFADQAEMLACLARDWRHGDRGAWWWHSLLNTELSEETVVRSLLHAITEIPSAIERLARIGIAAEIVESISSPSCDRLAASIAAAFAIPGRRDSRSRGVAASSAAGRQRRPGAPGPLTIDRLDAALALTTSHEGARLTSPQRALLAMALVVRRDPALARSPGIQELIDERAWQAPNAAPSEGRQCAPEEVADTIGHAAARPPIESIGEQHERRDDPEPSSMESVPAEPVRMRSPREWEHGAPRSAAEASGHDRAGDADRSTPAVDPDSPEPDQWSTSADATIAAYVESGFAGVVYLINLALHLELYGDFTQPLRPGLDLPIGDFLALVGERVCGAAFRDDPIWCLLARLAGRACEEAPAVNVDPPDDLTLDEWIDRLTKVLASRAAPVLDIAAAEVLAFLCVRPGRVALSSTRLDVAFSLDEHPLSIRVAGLDRNPGWVPAAGRHVEIHYD